MLYAYIFFCKYVQNNKIEKKTNKIKNTEYIKTNMNHKYNQKRNGS